MKVKKDGRLDSRKKVAGGPYPTERSAPSLIYSTSSSPKISLLRARSLAVASISSWGIWL